MLALIVPQTFLQADASLIDLTLSLGQAQSMAVSHSDAISQQANKILLKRMKYVEAVEGIRTKVKDLRSFRWTPLLSFKFPQKLKIPQEYDLNAKPLTLQAEIDTMVHKKADLVFKETGKATEQFYEVYLLQESSKFTQQKLDDAKDQLKRNTAGLLTADATQADVDLAKSSVEKNEQKLAAQLRDFEKAKKDLSDTIGVDVTVGYRFLNGYKQASIPRDQLNTLVQYTLDHDQSFYEAKSHTAVAQLNLETYEELMQNRYGSQLNPIHVFINASKKGQKVDYAAFQIEYKKMLKAMDQPWKGSFRILFFKINKEWIKGSIDGTRYIADEMYAVYTACQEYSNAVNEQASLEKELSGQVRDSYETIVTNWNSYLSLQALSQKSKETLDRLLALNKLGKATYSEVADQQLAYQETQQDTLDALHAYNIALSTFDSLTCGAISKYLNSSGMGLDAGDSGDAYSILDPIHDPYYYIYSSVADLTFNIGVSIPNDFEPAIDSYEVWYGGMQIGERMQTGDELRHLMLDYRDTNLLVIRLYNGDTFVDECEINATVPRDVLKIERTEPQKEGTRVIGTYEVKTLLQGGIATSQLTMRVDAKEKIASYTLTYGKNGIYTSEKTAADKPFNYLTILISSLDDVKIQMYGADGEKLLDAQFKSDTQELITVPAES